MDNKTRRKLMKINRDALSGSLAKEELVHKDQIETLKRMSKNTTTKEDREKVAELLENPTLYKTELVIDRSVTEELERKTEYRIKRAIERGEIPPPDEDKFMNRIKQQYGNKTN